MATYAEYVFLIFLSLPSYENLLLNFTFIFADFIFFGDSLNSLEENYHKLSGEEKKVLLKTIDTESSGKTNN